MKRKFSHLEFQPTPGLPGKRCKVLFKNGYGASVIRMPFSYGNTEGLYELAIIGKDNRIAYNTGITDDVLGNLTEDEVLEYLEKVENLK